MANGRILVFGACGMLGGAVVRFAPAGWEVVGVDREECDIADRNAVSALMGKIMPERVVNCAAYTNVDGCESERDEAFRVNATGTGVLAACAREAGAPFTHVSTDFVFDGNSRRPYLEEDATGPINAYGASKLAGEEAVRASGHPEWRIVRTSWLFGPGGRNFVDTMARLSLKNRALRVVADQTGRPTYTEDLAAAIYALFDATPGLYHYANAGETTWRDLAAATVGRMRRIGAPVVTEEVVPIRTEDYPRAAKIPAYSVLSTVKFERATGLAPPAWEDALEKYFREYGKSLLP